MTVAVREKPKELNLEQLMCKHRFIIEPDYPGAIRLRGACKYCGLERNDFVGIRGSWDFIETKVHRTPEVSRLLW